MEPLDLLGYLTCFRWRVSNVCNVNRLPIGYRIGWIRDYESSCRTGGVMITINTICVNCDHRLHDHRARQIEGRAYNGEWYCIFCMCTSFSQNRYQAESEVSSGNRTPDV